MADAGANIQICSLCGENHPRDRQVVPRCLEKQMGPYLCTHPGCTKEYALKEHLRRHYRVEHGSHIYRKDIKGVNARKYIREYRATVSGNTLILEEI